jgi:hypothetical protein
MSLASNKPDFFLSNLIIKHFGNILDHHLEQAIVPSTSKKSDEAGLGLKSGTLGKHVSCMANYINYQKIFVLNHHMLQKICQPQNILSMEP